MAERKSQKPKAKRENQQSAEPNEGEGNRTYARKFDADERRFVDSGKVEEKAHEAEEALAGPEGDTLRRAEEEGRSHSKGEDPLLNRGASKKP